MRVVQINSYSNGSTGHIANTIHQALLSNGDESLFAYGSGPELPEGGYRIGNKRDVSFHTYATLLTGLHGYCSVRATRRLVKKLKAFQPDIVHLHNLHGSYLNLKILLRYLSKQKIKTVITAHDCWLYTGKCYHYYEAKCDKYLQKCGNCPQLAMYPKSLRFDRTAKMLKDKQKLFGAIPQLYVVTISDWLHNQVAESFLGERPITTIRNGVNSIYRIYGDGKPAGFPEQFSDKFVILGVASSWNQHKGISDFIKLADMLSEDEVIVLVGHIKNDVTLPGNIVTIDHTENMKELADIYNAASVYVSMSTEETFGLTIAEALSCGLPSVVYGATACPEMIAEEENGGIAQPHDIKQVYDRIQQIKKATWINKTAISEKAREKYSTQRMAEEYLAFYREIQK